LVPKNEDLGTNFILWALKMTIFHEPVLMREDVLTQVFRAGGVRSVSIAMVEGRCVVAFVTGEGVSGHVQTKAGHIKFYRIETALKFLSQLGVSSVTVDLSGMTAQGQREMEEV
jgi:hypothetical protein